MTLFPPFWPLYMALASALVVAGAFRGHWVAPSLILGGLVAMRVIVFALPSGAQELAAAAVWLAVAALLFYNRWYVSGALVCMSGLTYAVLFVIGLRITEMGIVSFIADPLLVLALLAIGGGVFGFFDGPNVRNPALHSLSGNQGGLVASKEVRARNR